jgi:hypothetical protein
LVELCVKELELRREDPLGVGPGFSLDRLLKRD